jgi:hypothetical protein
VAVPELGIDCRRSGLCTHAIRVVRLLVPNDLAAVITEIIGESLAAFWYRTAHSTDPPLRSAKVGPRLILLAFGVVGAHDV